VGTGVGRDYGRDRRCRGSTRGPAMAVNRGRHTPGQLRRLQAAYFAGVPACAYVRTLAIHSV